MDDLDSLARLIRALRPWLDRVVIIGGWGLRLHRFHPDADSPRYQPVQTGDADIAFSLEAPPEGDIATALKSEEFRAELLSDNTPPVTHYYLGHDEHGFYVEFLTALRGSGTKRDGKPDATVAQAGVTAQKLRYLDLLMLDPWTVRLDESVGVPIEPPADVRLPSPVTFIAQKLLIRRSRAPDKQAQDVLYIHDAIELFAKVLPLLSEHWHSRIRPAIPTSVAQDIERLQRSTFAGVDDVIRRAARIPLDRTLTPERIRELCSEGLDRIYSSS